LEEVNLESKGGTRGQTTSLNIRVLKYLNQFYLFRGKKSTIVEIKSKNEGDIPDNFSNCKNNSSYRSTSMTTSAFLEKYTVGCFLNKGGLAKIYKCKNDITKVQYAVKIVYKSHLVAYPQVDLLSQNERRVLKLLASSGRRGLNKLVEILEDVSRIFIVLELIQGVDLADWLNHRLKAKIFSASAVKNITKQMVEELYYLHSRGIAHRDIKLENVMYVDPEETGTPHVVLVDFGTASQISLQRDRRSRTQVGFTSMYMPPECHYLRPGSYIDYKKGDMFSLGIMIYELMMLNASHKYLYTDEEVSEMKKTNMPLYRSDALFWRWISNPDEQLKEFVERCLDPIPKTRISSLEALTFFDEK
jgi:serine/threonine protein kinase